MQTEKVTWWLTYRQNHVDTAGEKQTSTKLTETNLDLFNGK